MVAVEDEEEEEVGGKVPTSGARLEHEMRTERPATWGGLVKGFPQVVETSCSSGWLGEGGNGVLVWFWSSVFLWVFCFFVGRG